MRKCFILLAVMSIIGASAYARGAEQVAPFAAAQLDKERLLNRLADLKPFQAEKEGLGAGSAFPVTREEFKNSLLFLSPERTDEVMNAFGMAIAFSFKSNTQFLILTQWQDQKSAEHFMQVEGELWRLKDEEYKKYIKQVDYKDIEIAEGEKALVTRKTIEQGGQKQDVTSFVSARKAYFFECTLMGTYESSEVKKLILQIWKIVESEAKKGQR
jgi:hypothetical protein